MPFDKPTRNVLARMVGAARETLKADIIAQLQTGFRLQPDGTTLSFDGLPPSGIAAAQELHELLQHYAAQLPPADDSAKTKLANQKSAFDRLAREIGFTILNRLAALRLSEERGLVVECVHKGMASEGFQLFERLTGGGLGPRYSAYRAFLENLFDELAIDLGALFDRGAPLSHVFPSERALEEVLRLLNDPALADLWKEDETIGWIYQYYNDEAERKKMRDESQAPRNSRELAVRNQFFTPRYVVEFLTDNTLGRLWYETRGGETRLAEVCRYLVRRPEEKFTTENTEKIQKENSVDSVILVVRKKKDPREITMLDPAGGSGHFGLYCFDLFEIIYEEAYDDLDLGPTLQADYPDRAEFSRHVPRLILAHNIHIIDIDPRAVQIAALALWLRAQRSFQRQGLRPNQRPQIRKVNVVCAEPMPGERDLLDEFASALQPPELGELVRFVFDRMQLAGEAGSLLKIEEDLREEIETLRKKLGPLFEGDSDFWTNAEARVLDALRDYAEQVSNGKSARRRLFADDAAHGFAFIDLCRKRYNVVLMNPPFGETSLSAEPYLSQKYPDWNFNLFCCFVGRACEWSEFVGAITDRAYMLKTSYDEYRKKRHLEPRRLSLIVDLGWGVLDANVEVNLQVYEPSADAISFLDISSGHDERGKQLLTSCEAHTDWISHRHSYFLDLPNAVLSYALPEWQQLARERGSCITEIYSEAKSGLKAGRVEQFVRLIWEVPEHLRGGKKLWSYFQNGGPYAPFYYSTNWVLHYETDWRDIRAIPSSRITGLDDYWKPGLTYGKRTDYIYAYPMPGGQVFSNEGMAVFPKQWDNIWNLLAFINSASCQALMNLLAGQHKAHSYFNKMWLRSPISDQRIASLASQIYNNMRIIDGANETSINFLLPIIGSELKSFDEVKQSLNKVEGLIKEATEGYFEVNRLVADILGDKTLGESRLPNWFSILYEDSASEHLFTSNLVSYIIGCVMGRWDIRIALDSTLAPKLQDPFDPLPVCSPGMLVGPDGLPATPGNIVSEAWLRARPNAITLPELTDNGRKTKDGSPTTIADSEYLLRIAWDGILVDDPGLDGQTLHDADIVRRVREALAVLWGDKADSIEAEACELLEVQDLRDYFRKPSGFFADHLKRYSKSRRQAPIYWPLSTASGGYTVWVYYHRLTADTLHTIVNRYVTPKIENTQQRAEVLAEKLAAASGKAGADLRGQHDEAKTLLSELTDFRAELLRIAALPYKPNLNDGVILNAAPLHKLFRLGKWAKDCKAAWDKLAAGEYDWAHIAYALWPKRVEKVCETDRSIAIAHGLEHLCKVEAKKPKARRKKKGEDEEAETMEMDL